MKYFMSILFILLTFSSCTYFDPMHGISYLDYGNEYSRTFSGEPAEITNHGDNSYSNIKVEDDNIYLVYVDDHEDRLILSKSEDGGSLWSDATLATTICYNVCLDVVDENIYISYIMDNTLYCIVSYDGGATIRTTTVGQADVNADAYTGITGHENRIFISYCNRNDNDRYDLMCAYSSDQGRSFSVSLVQSGADFNPFESAIDYNPQTENSYITFQYNPVDGTRIGFAKSADFQNWEVSNLGYSFHQSSGVIADGAEIVHIVHTGEGPTYYTSTDDGSTWSGGTDIDATCADSRDISFSQDGSILYTAYYDAFYGRLNVSTYNGTWSARTVDGAGAKGGVEGRKCSIDALGNLVFISYIINDGALYLAKSTDGGSTWNTDPGR